MKNIKSYTDLLAYVSNRMFTYSYENRMDTGMKSLIPKIKEFYISTGQELEGFDQFMDKLLKDVGEMMPK